MDNYNSAYSTVENRRLAAKSRHIAKLEEINSKIPQLEDINSRITQAGAAQAIAVISKQPTEAEKHKARIAALLEERKQLLEVNGFREEDLQPIYYCNICKDTGFVNGRTCSCIRNEIISQRQKTLTKFSPVPDVSFESFNPEMYPKQARQLPNQTMIVPYNHMKAIFDYCKAYSENFSLKNKSLIMLGASGLGKTHLACSIARVVMEKGYVVMYTSAQSFFNKVEQAKYTDEDVLSDILACDLFILDDLGAEHMTNYSLSILYNIVNTRMIENKPAIYTTNIMSDAALKQRYGEKIYSRLVGNSQRLYFHGDDIRIKKNR